ncbi:hypothetical protein NL676_008454 [Syzygium grande]|nr:hypothetical protein NL676_008454 [Syzygium grande]
MARRCQAVRRPVLHRSPTAMPLCRLTPPRNLPFPPVFLPYPPPPPSPENPLATIRPLPSPCPCALAHCPVNLASNSPAVAVARISPVRRRGATFRLSAYGVPAHGHRATILVHPATPSVAV